MYFIFPIVVHFRLLCGNYEFHNVRHNFRTPADFIFEMDLRAVWSR